MCSAAALFSIVVCDQLLRSLNYTVFLLTRRCHIFGFACWFMLTKLDRKSLKV